VALVLGAMFFLSLAFNRGWITPEARVLIGLAASAAALGLGAWLFERGQGAPALVLVAVGVAVGMLALFAATELYGFVGPEAGLLAAFVLAIGAAAIAVRADSQIVAALGLLAVLGAPPILGADPNLFAVAFLGTALAGTTAIALWRSWPWLPSLALLVTAPQLADWLAGDQPVALGAAVVAGYWLVNAVGAAGESLLGRGNQLHRSSATALVGNALFAIAALHDVLGELSPLVRTAALFLLAGAHLVPAVGLVRGPGRALGRLVAGIAAGTLAIAIGLEFGGVYQPMAWTALAVVLAAVAIQLDDRGAALGAAAAASLAVVHLVTIDYPIVDIMVSEPTGMLPFASGAGIVLGTMVAGVVVVTALAVRMAASHRAARRRRAAPFLLVAGMHGAFALLAYAAPFELSHAGAVVLWSILAGIAFVVGAAFVRSRAATELAFAGGAILVAIGAFVVVRLLAPLDRLLVNRFSAAQDVTPFVNDETGALLALVVALAVAALVAPRRDWAASASIGAGSIALYLGSVGVVDVFRAQVGGSIPTVDLALQAHVALSIGWVLTGAAAFALGLVRGIAVARLFGLALLILATVKVFLVDLASLDVAHRVLSFIGLGFVLLASAFLAARLRRPLVEPDGEEPRSHPA
jgi:uncharacterized membrane protein